MNSLSSRARALASAVLAALLLTTLSGMLGIGPAARRADAWPLPPGSDVVSVTDEEALAAADVAPPAEQAPEAPTPEKAEEPRTPERAERSRPAERPRSRWGIAWPVNGIITSGFGPRRSGTHSGIDQRCWTGHPVKPAAPGRVVFVGWHAIYGRMIILNHAHGFRTLYAHLSAKYVRNGQWVRADDIIARCGNTGRSFGPHLHFEVYRYGKVRNPLDFLPRR